MILGLVSLKESLSSVVFYSKLLYKIATFCRNRSIDVLISKQLYYYPKQWLLPQVYHKVGQNFGLKGFLHIFFYFLKR